MEDIHLLNQSKVTEIIEYHSSEEGRKVMDRVREFVGQIPHPQVNNTFYCNICTGTEERNSTIR